MKKLFFFGLINLLTLSSFFISQVLAADTIKLGLAGPLTGSQGAIGEQVKNGASIAMEEWNEKGGILGKKIEIVWGDDQADPKQAVSVANKFVNEGVLGVIGHVNSSCSIPASTVYTKADIVHITPSSTNPQLTERGSKTVFRVCGRDDQQGGIAADFIVNNLRKTKVAVFHDKTTYGQGLADEVVKGLKKLGTEPVFYTGIVQGDKDYTAVLTAAKQKDPEVLYFGGIYPEAILLVRQSRDLGLNTIFMGGDGLFVPEFIEGAGPAAEGTYMSFFSDPERIPEAQPFLKKFKEKFPQTKEVGGFTVYSYAATNILLQAIQATGSTDGKKLADYIRNTKFDTALGPIQFDEKGDILQPFFVLWQVKGGKFVQVQELRRG